MPRKLTSHKVNNCNEQLEIEVLDEPGAGGANHLYQITGFNTKTNPSDPFTVRHGAPAVHSTVLFQNGPIGEAGVNGVTQEALLAIVEDRLSSFQNGPYACEENQWALDHVRKALDWLHARTDRRLAAGIEGTHQPDNSVTNDPMRAKLAELDTRIAAKITEVSSIPEKEQRNEAAVMPVVELLRELGMAKTLFALLEVALSSVDGMPCGR